MALIEEAHKAARILLDHAYVRIVAAAEPDATCAAALLAHALRRENVDFHVSWVRRLDDADLLRSLAEERADCLVTIGLAGEAAVPELPAARHIAIDVQGGNIRSDAAVHDDAALASLAHLVAAGISRRNVDLAPLAVAGALAAWRHVGGVRGLDAEVLQEALDSRVMLRESALALDGANLLAALSQLDAPFVAGITGRARNAKKLVTDLELSADALPESLTDAHAEEIGSFLSLRLLQRNAPDAALDALFRPALRGLQGPHTGLECGELARLAEAGCASQRCGLAFAALWPDPGARAELETIRTSVREELVSGLLRAEREARREGHLHVVECARPGLCRPLADRVALSLAPANAITIAHAPDGDGAFLATRAWSKPPRDLWVPDATRAIKTLSEAAP